jgi:hypothetical protein
MRAGGGGTAAAAWQSEDSGWWRRSGWVSALCRDLEVEEVETRAEAAKEISDREMVSEGKEEEAGGDCDGLDLGVPLREVEACEAGDGVENELKKRRKGSTMAIHAGVEELAGPQRARVSN